jgi:hypothetical protein
MTNFTTKDKRSENGSIISFDAYSTTADTTNKVINELKGYRTFNILLEEFKSERVSLYFEKLIFSTLRSELTKFEIQKWHKNNEPEYDIQPIEIQSIPWVSILQKVWPDKTIPFAITKPGVTKYSSRAILSSIYKQMPLELNMLSPKFVLKHPFLSVKQIGSSVILKNKKLKEKIFDSKNTIAIKYAEGVDFKKRSDIFWFLDSRIDPSRILIYFENSYLPDGHGGLNQVIKDIEKLGFRWVCLRLDDLEFANSVWGYDKAISCMLLKRIKKKIQQINPKSSVEKWIIDESKNLINNISYWYSFFSEFNIKIQADLQESGQDNIVKNIALDLLGGISIGKERSWLSDHKGLLWGYYPNHVFCTWSKTSAEKYLNSNNSKDNVLITGFPYDGNLELLDVDSAEVKRNFEDEGVKFTICLFDNIHSMNNGLEQYIYTPFLIKFYQVFLNWIIEDKEFGLIIKSKKPEIIDSMPEIKTLLRVAEQSKRCQIISDELGAMPSVAAQVSDFAVATGVFFSSALIEAVLTGIRGVYCDYSNLKSCDKDIYNWGYQKVIFDDIDNMIGALKKYQQNPDEISELGDWSAHLDELDSFRDNQGGKRVGELFKWSLESFDSGFYQNEVLKQASSKYIKKWNTKLK